MSSLENLLRGLKDYCVKEGIYLYRNVKYRFPMSDLTGTMGVQIYTKDHVKCKIHFGQGVSETLIEGFFARLIPISQLMSLELFDIPYIPICIGQLVKLKILGVESSCISSLPPELSNLKSLTELTLRLEHMKVLPDWILELKDLAYLDLFGSGIEEIPLNIDHLKKLRVMDLSGTHLKKIPYTILNLQLPIKNYFNEIKATGIYICDATCDAPPVNVIAGGRKRLEMYYHQHEFLPQNEVRVILLGLKGSGKTSMVQRIRELADGNSYYKKENEWTEGISINDINCKKDGVLHMWDFGGQEIMLSTHTLFLRDHCIYIIVLNARQGDDPDRWLDYISQYGKHSTVFIVNNHMDEADIYRPDINKIRRLYPNLVRQDSRIWEISCENPEAFPLDEFYDRICKEAKTYFERKIPLAWSLLSHQLSDMKKSGKKVNYITQRDYEKLCEECGIKDRKEIAEVLSWLNEIGVVFTYGNSKAIENMNEFKVLRPAWVTDAIYKIINNVKTQQDKCMIIHDDIRQALCTGKAENGTGNIYTDMEILFILEVMRKFGLSFQFSKDSEFIPAVARNEEFPEVVEWMKNRDNTLLDMVFQLSSLNPASHQESSINLTQFYQVIIKIAEEFHEFPHMWHSGALYSHVLDMQMLLFLQNNGTWSQELRLIIKGKHEDSKKAVELQWKILMYLKQIIADYTIDAKVFVPGEKGEYYFSVDRAIGTILNGFGAEQFVFELDRQINLYEDVICKAIPNIQMWERGMFDSLKAEIRSGIKKTDEALQILYQIQSLEEGREETYKKILIAVEKQDELWSQCYLQEIYNSEELWKLHKELTDSCHLQEQEFGRIKEELASLLDKGMDKKDIKKRLMDCLNVLATGVTLATADYGKVMRLMELLMELALKIVV